LPIKNIFSHLSSSLSYKTLIKCADFVSSTIS
jgi:hypothetical protein